MKILSDSELARIKERAIEEYKNQQAQQAEDKKALYKEVNTHRSECLVGFNFNDPNITVFSIERTAMHDPLNERTIIGYYLTADANSLKEGTPMSGEKFVREWYLLCSREAHNELVKAFAEIKKTSKSLLKG